MDVLNLLLDIKENTNISVKIYNMDGTAVSVPVDNMPYQMGLFNLPISVSMLSSGNYYMVVSGNNELAIRDFVVVH